MASVPQRLAAQVALLVLGTFHSIRCTSALNQSIRLSNGVMMPLVSLGTAGFNDTDVEEVVASAISAGFLAIDTAFNYYNQVGIGKALKQHDRTKLFIITKTSPCQHSQAPPPYNITDVAACKEQTKKDIESNFQQLDVDYVDLLLLHGANHFGSGGCGELACRLNQAQWEIYESYYNLGKAKAIGVSNFCPSCLEALSTRVRPVVNQLKFHVGMTADPDALMSYCERQHIVPMAYSPMGSGEVLTDHLLTEIGASHGKTTAQIALKWIVEKGYPVATKSRELKHLQEDLDLFSWDLLPAEVQKLDAYLTPTDDKPSWACTTQETIV